MKLPKIIQNITSLFNPEQITQPVLKNLFAHPHHKTILIIDDYVPYYDKSSGSKRLFELILLFKTLNFNVVFLPNDGLATEPYYSRLVDLGVDVLLNAPSRNGMLKGLMSILNKIDYAWISRPLLNQEFQQVIKRNKNIKIIFDTVDLHYIRMLRQAANENDERLKRKALKTKKLELGLATTAHATITVTATEKETLEKEGIKNVFVIPNIHHLNIPDQPLPFEEREGIVFIGGYKHVPNIDAAKWLINEIMPLVWIKLGKIPTYLLGSDPTNEVLDLASDCVFVPGYLPNVDSYFLSKRLFVAPLRYGAGMKGKVGQSLEFGLPIVSTAIGNEGMNLINDFNILEANDAETFAAKIIELYKDPVLWHKIRNNAISAISVYAPKSVTVQLEALFKALAHQ